LSNLWQMAGRNYFFLKLAGQYTKHVLSKVIWEERIATPMSENALSHCSLQVLAVMRNEALRSAA